MVPKQDAGAFRLVQNLSFPYKPDITAGISSINSAIESDLYPCTWGTFATVCLTVWRLPEGSQAAVRDVEDAYRCIGMNHSQWAGQVVRLEGDDAFAVDMFDCFGLRSGAGLFGRVADAAADIFRAEGMGPLSKWVDDFMFIRILLKFLAEYNKQRERLAAEIALHGGLRQSGGRLWYRGNDTADGRGEEFDEDKKLPIKDLSKRSIRSKEDARFSYCMADIDRVSAPLGVVWKLVKDSPFGPIAKYDGFSWDLVKYQVSVPKEKKERYYGELIRWEEREAHTLDEVQSLYGKLQHVSLIAPEGSAYLTEFEKMIATGTANPMASRHASSKHMPSDIRWWKALLSRAHVYRPIPGLCTLIELQAYSDASSEVGIGIVIRGRWRAWRLIPGWQRDGRDISWAEGVGFELLARTIGSSTSPGEHYRLFGDNQGVVEGWWNGRSRNRQTNGVFKRVHQLSSELGCTFHTRYVASADNPADGPSRGVYPPSAYLLPATPIPAAIREFVVDFDAPLREVEIKHARGATSRPKAAASNKISEHARRDRLEHQRIRINTDVEQWKSARKRAL
jgi:hypothetical protein